MSNLNIVFFFIPGLFLLSTLLVGLYARFARERGIIDAPQERRPHMGYIPRGAGIIFMSLWCLTALLGFLFQLISGKTILLFLPITGLMSFIGFWDDFKGLSAKTRLKLQVILASIFIGLLLGLEGVERIQLFFSEYGNILGSILGSMGILCGLLGIIWSINLYNFMDGIDGIAAIEALFILGVGSYICYEHGAFELAILSWILFVSVAGFLVWNWPKAAVFMGDVGSYCLGCFIGVLTLVGYWSYDIPIAVWLILYALFWFDASLTLIRRFLLKKNIISPHQDHGYQRLFHAGFSVKKLLVGVVVLNTLLALLALYANTQPDSILVCFLLSLLLLTLVTVWIEKRNPLSSNPMPLSKLPNPTKPHNLNPLT